MYLFEPLLVSQGTLHVSFRKAPVPIFRRPSKPPQSCRYDNGDNDSDDGAETDTQGNSSRRTDRQNGRGNGFVDSRGLGAKVDDVRADGEELARLEALGLSVVPRVTPALVCTGPGPIAMTVAMVPVGKLPDPLAKRLPVELAVAAELSFPVVVAVGTAEGTMVVRDIAIARLSISTSPMSALQKAMLMALSYDECELAPDSFLVYSWSNATYIKVSKDTLLTGDKEGKMISYQGLLV
ncbi:hypothetical protein MMC15_004306 [Xylographa vitiligo]|nr:hypothetical protein [Xylographa vitiligo]